MRGLLIVLMLMATPAMAAPDPVKDCPKGLVCLTPDEAIALRGEVIDLREDLAKVKARQLSRFGHVLGCGGGLAVNDSTGSWEPGVYCGYMFGYRF